MTFDQEISIGKYKINKSQPVFIIAEAGVNHGGDINLAKQLIDVAVNAGADAVKFQAFRTDHLILSDVEKAPYQTQTTSKDELQSEMLKKLELSKSHYTILKDYCNQKGIVFLITPFDEFSLTELEEIGVEAYKIASTDTTNLPFLNKVALTGKPIFLSTGMCYLDEVALALKEIEQHNKKVVLLQCTANYPIKDEEANLKVIQTYQNTFNILTGYSDHSVGLGACLSAVPLGAVVVEKHFTLDKSLSGPDHLASLDPNELKALVTELRRVEKYMGNGVKTPTASESATKKSLQKCLVASMKIEKGSPLSDQNMIAKRTGGKGISPIRFHELNGVIAQKNYEPNDIIDEKL